MTDGSSTESAPSSEDRRPVVVWAVVLLVVLEAAVLVGLGIAFALELVRGTELASATVFLCVFSLALAGLLLAAARGLRQGRRWARAPVMTWQVLLAVMAAGWVRAQPTGWSIAVLVVALGTGVGLVLPPVVRATTGVTGWSGRPRG